MSNYDSDDDEEVVEIGFQSASIGGNNSNQLWASSSSDDYGRPSAPPPASSTLNPTSPSLVVGSGSGGGSAAGVAGRPHSSSGGSIISSSNSREIAIFWDLPGCLFPDWMTTEEASNVICEAVSRRLPGTVVDRRLYVDMDTRGKISLDAPGFIVVNDFITEQQHPSAGIDNVVSQKKILVDLTCFGWDRTTRRQQQQQQQQFLQQYTFEDVWVVLLTNDESYAYALSELRDRGVKSLLIYSGDEESQLLRAAATDALRFHQDVLGIVPRQQQGQATNIGTAAEIQATTYAERVAMDRIGTFSSSPAPDQEWTTVTSTKHMIPRDVQILCKVLDEGAKESIDTEDWVLGSKLGVLFRGAMASKTTSSTVDIKESYKNARDTAIQKNFVERGFKFQGSGPKKNQIVPERTNERWKEQGKLSKEDFFRLTKEGKQVLKTASVTTSKPDTKRTNVFIKNIPKEMHVTTFVENLERDYGVDVLRGYYLPGNNAEVAYTFACLQVMTSEDTELLLEASRKALLMAGGRVLACKINDGPYNSSAIDPNDEYRRPAGKVRQANPSQLSRVEMPLDQETNPALAYCRAVDAFLRQRTQNNIANLPDGWCDAGFWVQLKVALLGGDKDRVKSARSLALTKGWIEAGRRLVGTEGSTIQIEAVEGTRNPARHALELYVRVTDIGKMQLSVTSTRVVPVTTEGEGGESDSKLEDRLLFVKSLLPNTDVNAFVQFLESEYGLTLNKAWVEEPKATASFTNAHVEMQSTQDTLRMIHLASRAGEGIVYQKRPLEVVRDQRIPNFRKGDPRCYFREGDLLGTRRNAGLRSQSIGSADGNVTSSDIATVFCRVLRQKSLTKGGDRSWINSGSVGEGFMRHFRNVSSDQRKEMFARARQSVITNGLVDFGRRLLSSASQEVTLATFMGKYDSTKLSSESYLRLTPQGANVIMSNSSVLSEQLGGIVSNVAAKNGYFLNLPESAMMKDFVKYIESTHGVKIRYGVMRRTPGFVSAQVEFMTAEDYNIVNESLTVQDGLDYEGCKVRMREDKGVPDWSQARKSDGRIFYEAEPDDDDDLPPALLEEDDVGPRSILSESVAIPVRSSTKLNAITGDSLLSSDSAERIISMLSFDMPEDSLADALDSRSGGNMQAQDVFRQTGGERPSLFGSTFATDSETPARPPSNPSDSDLFHMVWDDQTKSFRRVPISRETLDRQMNQSAAMMRGSPADPAYLSSTPSPVPVQFRRVPDFEGGLNSRIGSGGGGFSDLPVNQSASLFPTQQAYNIHQPRPVFPSSQPGASPHFNRMPGPLGGEQRSMMSGDSPNFGSSQTALRPDGPPPGIFGGPPRGPPGIIFGGGSGAGGPPSGPPGIVGFGGHAPHAYAGQVDHLSSSVSQYDHPTATGTTDTGLDDPQGNKKWSDILKK
eukprot:CAMPEP_0113507768 /NCGR_PEP_ID=MMETSP0014_2-20120614/36646_1 /TAXON_ID=2857 /ORGANISM="Nitzschia sp." /LENGTH=1405 /DNA_ID=CAMNT_0000403409 /DNA_START=676 /DNA_END=4893 /DNA_ORIENTATION=- /assembly_acc=CAM_ASM_000159